MVEGRFAAEAKQTRAEKLTTMTWRSKRDRDTEFKFKRLISLTCANLKKAASSSLSQARKSINKAQWDTMKQSRSIVKHKHYHPHSHSLAESRETVSSLCPVSCEQSLSKLADALWKTTSSEVGVEQEC